MVVNRAMLIALVMATFQGIIVAISMMIANNLKFCSS